MAVKLSEEAESRIEELKKLYPDSKSAIMPALYIAQEELGHVNEEAIHWVAEKIAVAPAHVMEVATFYTMYYKKPVGTYHFQVCRTLSCALCSAAKLSKHLADRFNISAGEVSSDGMWSFEEVECLGSCGSAPMCEINDRFFENLTVEKLDKIIDQIEKDKPDLRYSTVKDDLGSDLGEYPKSEVV